MTKYFASLMLAVALLTPCVAGADPVPAVAASSGAIISLYTSDVQPLTKELGFKVAEASVKDRQLWVIGEVINLSHATFNQVQMIVALEHGADLRVSVGRLVPGASRRVQARLATEFEHKPAILRVLVTEAPTEFRPGARARGR